MGRPKVSVSVATYNHEKYIGRALDSILMQEVDFEYQIVIGEDCSTDNTRRIVLSYKEKYPEKIKLLLHEFNIGMLENLKSLVLECDGQYVAKLEGDDYWTDPRKLQKQVNFLDSHPDYVACAHNVHIVDEGGAIRKDMPDRYWNDETFTIKKYQKSAVLGGHTASQVYRNIFKDMPQYRLQAFFDEPLNEDERLNLYLALEGKKFIFKEYMANWMVGWGGNWTTAMRSTDELRFEKYRFDSFKHLEHLAKTGYDYELDFSRQEADVFIYMIHRTLKKISRKKLKICCECFSVVSKKAMCYEIIKRIRKKTKHE